MVRLAHETGSTIITAESCTAGALGTLLADTPTSGRVFVGAVVSYAKESKWQLLGVPPDLLTAHGAVSSEIAAAMAEGALRACPAANLALATTGVCGPAPDEDGNPVGLAFVAVQRRGEDPLVQQHNVNEHSMGRVRGEIMRLALQSMKSALQRQSMSAKQ